MNAPREELSCLLARHVDAVQPVPADLEAEAQARLLQRLASYPAARPRRARLFAFAAAAALAAVVLLGLPLLRDEGQAFAAVQQHFRGFRTLAMTIEQRMGDTPLPRTRVWLDAAGRVRTDVGEQISVIVDPGAGRVVSLLHSEKQGTEVSLPVQAAPASGDALAWLEEIRRFQGEARRLPEPRRIAGLVAHGWELPVGDQRLVLWATEEGLPLAMEHAVPGGLRLDYAFEFDVALPAGYLDAVLPAGYERIAPEG